MQQSDAILGTFEITAPIFLLVMLGYFAVRLKYFPADGVRSLGAFVARIAVPVLIFKALAEKDLMQSLDVSYVIAYTLGSVVPYSAIVIYAHRYRGKDLSSASFYGMGGAFSNTIMVGYPVAIALFGEAALIPIALTLVVENLFMMPLTLGLADSAKGGGTSLVKRSFSTLKTITKNPIVIAIVLGVIASLLKLPVPTVGARVMELLAASVSGVALFSIGGMLVGLRAGGLLPDISAVVVTKLVLHPLAMFCAFALVGGVTPGYASVAVVLACSPMFSIFAVIGSQYGVGAFCAAVMLPTTALSFVTISLFIWAQAAFSF